MPLRLLHEADWAWRQRGPTRRAVRAFGVRADELRRMPAGEHTWTDGRMFLKPVGCIPEHTWVCEAYANWTATHVRVPEPVMPHGPGKTGWSSDGWGAQLPRARFAVPARANGHLRHPDRLMEVLVTHVKRTAPVVDAVVSR
jgi:hypothetical protein